MFFKPVSSFIYSEVRIVGKSLVRRITEVESKMMILI